MRNWWPGKPTTSAGTIWQTYKRSGAAPGGAPYPVQSTPRREPHRGARARGPLRAPKDDEPATVAAMDEYARAQGYLPDFSESRFHHEIYLSDVRRCKTEKLKTVIRQPVRKEVRP